jgi:hypothetical protein
MDDKGMKEIEKEMKENDMEKAETVNEIEKTEHVACVDPQDKKLKRGKTSEGEEILELEYKPEDNENGEMQQDEEKEPHKKDVPEVNVTGEGSESEFLREEAKTEGQNTREMKLKSESMVREKSEGKNGKVGEREKLKDDENEEQKPMERGGMEDRMDVKGEEEQEKGKLFI